MLLIALAALICISLRAQDRRRAYARFPQLHNCQSDQSSALPIAVDHSGWNLSTRPRSSRTRHGLNSHLDKALGSKKQSKALRRLFIVRKDQPKALPLDAMHSERYHFATPTQLRKVTLPYPRHERHRRSEPLETAASIDLMNASP